MSLGRLMITVEGDIQCSLAQLQFVEYKIARFLAHPVNLQIVYRFLKMGLCAGSFLGKRMGILRRISASKGVQSEWPYPDQAPR